VHLVCRDGRLDGRWLVGVCGYVRLGRRVVRQSSLGSDGAGQVDVGQTGTGSRHSWAGGFLSGLETSEAGVERGGGSLERVPLECLGGGDREIQNGGDGALSPVRAGHDQGEDAARRTLVEFRDGAGMAVDVNVGLSRTSRGGNSNSSSGDNAWMGLFQE
jgi:hypothetical protein